MPIRRRPYLVATRVTRAERVMIEAVAETQGVTVTELLREIVLPAVGERVAAQANELRGAADDAEAANGQRAA